MSSLDIFDDPQTREALSRMTIPEIRRAQDIVKAQIPLAYEQRNTDALEWLQRAEDEYIAELLRRPTS